MCEIQETLTRNLCAFFQDGLFGRNMEITTNDWGNREGVDIEISIVQKHHADGAFNKRVDYMEFTYAELDVLSKVINKILGGD